MYVRNKGESKNADEQAGRQADRQAEESIARYMQTQSTETTQQILIGIRLVLFIKKERERVRVCVSMRYKNNIMSLEVIELDDHLIYMHTIHIFILHVFSVAYFRSN